MFFLFVLFPFLAFQHIKVSFRMEVIVIDWRNIKILFSLERLLLLRPWAFRRVSVWLHTICVFFFFKFKENKKWTLFKSTCFTFYKIVFKPYSYLPTKEKLPYLHEIKIQQEIIWSEDLILCFSSRMMPSLSTN